jgi:hypothetical protein
MGSRILELAGAKEYESSMVVVCIALPSSNPRRSARSIQSPKSLVERFGAPVYWSGFNGPLNSPHRWEVPRR